MRAYVNSAPPPHPVCLAYPRNRRSLPGRADLHIIDGGDSPPTHDGGVLRFGGASVTDYPIIQQIDYLRDTLVGRIVYGDGGPDGTRPDREPTQSVTEYDIRRRPFRMRTLREPTSPPISDERPLSAVSTVVDQRLTWDAANNLTAKTDDRPATEWPQGNRPQTVHIRHDALYRVVGTEYDYTQDDGSRTVVDVGTDWREEMARTKPNDPMETEPAPMVPELPEQRVVSLTWEYDWLSNMESWTDDAAAFYERSIGDIENGTDFASGTGDEPALRPSALYVSSQLDSTSVTMGAGGWLQVRYGVSGNVTSMTVHGQCSQSPRGTASACTDSVAGESSPESKADRLRAGCSCANEQHYVYKWDELNRLAEARRYDRSTVAGRGAWQLGARLRYRYDGSNQRTVKDVHTEGEDGEPPPPDRIALYVYPGDFERRGLSRDASGLEYDADPALLTEAQYLVAGARVVWKPGSPELGLDRDHRITFNIPDLLQTTTAVVDVLSGELLEHSSYYPNGAREAYLTGEDGDVQPEPIGFTGKEADAEVGIVYFGERYLLPHLGRWASPDPLHVHAAGGGEALNSYHYVGGNLLQGRDPLGLNDEAETREQLKDSAQPVRVQGAQRDQLFVIVPGEETPEEGIPDMSAAEISQAVEEKDALVFKHDPDADQTLQQALEDRGLNAGGHPRGTCTHDHCLDPETGRIVGNAAEGVETAVEVGETAAGAGAALKGLKMGLSKALEKVAEAIAKRRTRRQAAREGADAAEAAAARGGTYKLRDPETGRVRRTGRTNDLDRRRGEHGRHPETRDLEFEVDRRTDSYPAQRGREQRIYDEHPEADLNHKRPISPTNRRRDEYLREGDEL